MTRYSPSDRTGQNIPVTRDSDDLNKNMATFQSTVPREGRSEPSVSSFSSEGGAKVTPNTTTAIPTRMTT